MEGSRGATCDDILSNYKIGETLGIGSFGTVKIANHVLTGSRVAIKIMDRSQITKLGMEEKVSLEIKILRLLQHPHVVRLYEVIDTGKKLYLVMEYIKEGELLDYIMKGRLSEEEARRLFQQIISGVEYCHRNMVVHRDLKLENLLLDSNYNVKIVDFGLSNFVRDGHCLKTNCGSPNYAAPEVVSGKPYAGPEVDVWSCGIILYALLCGTFPFDHSSIPFLFKIINAGVYTLPNHLSALARDLIARMLVVDPVKRITIHDIRMHPWYQANLPRYLAVPPPGTMQQAKIDEEIFQKIVQIGFDRNQLVESLHKRIQNQGTVAYSLLVDNRFRGTSYYLGPEFQNAVESGFSCMNSGVVPTSKIFHCLSGNMDNQGMVMTPSPPERKWALGFQSRARPVEIMTEVLKALQELNVRWKMIGHYNMTCRWFPGVTGHSEDMLNNQMHANHGLDDESAIAERDDVIGNPSNVVKFELQLYKTKENGYLVDLQRVSGPHLLFLDLCSALLAQLRVV